MKNVTLLFILILVAIQAAGLLLVWGSPAQQVERSHTPTPRPLPPTAIPTPALTPIPTLPYATLPPGSGQ